MAVPERSPVRAELPGPRIDAAIGTTPVVRLTRVVDPGMAEVWVKIEGMNPGGSIKDRTALGMIVDAERSGALRPGQMIVEPTSGNTGIGLAQVAAARGYPLTLCLPAQMSEERKRTLLAYGSGTGGTISGVGRFLRQRNPGALVVAVEPARSPVLSGGDRGQHQFQG